MENRNAPSPGNNRKRLPSMPAAAEQVLRLAERGLPEAAELQRAVQGDPASVLALLAAAARDRRRPPCGSLRAAIERLGVAAALRECLGFHLADRRSAGGIDCIRHWRRALLSGAYARAIARRLRRHDSDQLQTAAVLRHAFDLGGGSALCGESGAWLQRYGIADALCAAVQASRAPSPADAAACIALAVQMAEVWLHSDWERNLARTHDLAAQLFGTVPDLCAWVFGVLGPQAQDLDELLRVRWLGRRRNAALLARAQALLQVPSRPTGCGA